jgi:anti-sigma factor RsiW
MERFDLDATEAAYMLSTWSQLCAVPPLEIAAALLCAVGTGQRELHDHVDGLGNTTRSVQVRRQVGEHTGVRARVARLLRNQAHAQERNSARRPDVLVPASMSRAPHGRVP